MKNTFRLYGVVLVIVIIIIFILEANKTVLTDWSKNYEIDQKSPFGLFVFQQEANRLFNNKLTRIASSPYKFYSDSTNMQPHNIIIHQLYIDKESWKKLLQNVEQGGDLLVISNDINYSIKDSLKITTANYEYRRSDVTYKFTDKKLVNDSIIIDKSPTNVAFIYLNENHEVLSHQTNYNNEASFIKVNHGKGHIYFHSEPLILTNYYLLNKDNKAYIENVFSYLPDRESIWFTKEIPKVSSASVLRFVLANPALRYAWWLLLGGLLIFIIFNSKRKQRIVPIIDPLENKSLEFVKSIGNLYFQEGNVEDMASKKIQYFLYYIRTDLLIDTKILDAKFIELLHLKSGKNLEVINQTIELIHQFQENQSQFTEENLIRLNRLIDQIIK